MASRIGRRISLPLAPTTVGHSYSVKKVLVFRAELLPYSETFIQAQVQSYSRWKPVLVGARPIDGGLSLEGIETRYLSHRPRTFIGKLCLKLARALRLPPAGSVSLLRRESASIVHVHFATDAVEFWPIISRLALPVIVTLHGFDISIYPEWWIRERSDHSGRKYPSRLIELSKNPCIHFVAVSESIRDRAIEFGIPADRIIVRYMGINLSEFHPSGRPASQRARRILYVGRLVEKKGGIHLIRAVAEVMQAVPDVELVMIGDGPLMNQYRELVRELNLPVRFLGSLTSAKVRDQMALARVFCLPSVRARNGDAEGLPISILEAQACGVPVITSALGGATEGILDGITGFAFPEGDVRTLGALLIKLLQDSTQVDALANAGPRFVAEKFEIGHCTAALEDLYDSLTRGSKV